MNVAEREEMPNVLDEACIVSSSQEMHPLNSDNNKVAIVIEDVMLSPVNTSVTSTLTKVPVHGLNAISRFAEQSINRDHTKFTYSRTVKSTTSLLRTLHLPTLVPAPSLAFIPGNKLPMPKISQSLLRKSHVNDTEATVSSMLAAPSGANSSTVTHANRSLVYRKPVTTKDTAPIKNSNELNIIDLTENSSTCDEKINNSPDDSNKSIVVVQSEECVTSGDSLLAAIGEPFSKNSNELVIGTSFQLPRPLKQHFEQQYKILTTKTGNQQYPHVKEIWVSNKCHNCTHIVMIFCFDILSTMHFFSLF